MGLFSKKTKDKSHEEIDEIYSRNKDKSILPLSKFKVGQIYKMEPGYYTKNPYYIEIVHVDKESIVTYIPGHHSLHMKEFSGTWNYQTKRMTLVGDIKVSTDYVLLLNQPLN